MYKHVAKVGAAIVKYLQDQEKESED